MANAMKVTDKNIEGAIQYGAAFGQNLSDLRDTLLCYTEDGDMLYLVMGGEASKDNVTFSDHTFNDFFDYWEFDPEIGEMENWFVPIQPKGA